MQRNKRTEPWWGLLLVLLIALPFLVVPTTAKELYNNAQPAFTPIPLPAGVHPNSIVVSPDGKHVAFVSAIDGKQVVVQDGKPGTLYEKIRAPWMADGLNCLQDILPGLFFSPNGKRLAFSVGVGKKWAMVIDGVQGSAYDEIDLPVFSPDSQRVAYAAKRDGKWRGVVDGREKPPFDYIGTGGGMGADPSTIRPLFSPDSAHLVYVGRNQEDPHMASLTSYLVFDGKKLGPYQHIWHLIFAKNGKRYAYVVASASNHQIVIIDGKTSHDYSRVSAPAFSPDGTRVAFLAYLVGHHNDRAVLVLDGKEQPIERWKDQPPIFSPGGTRLAYIVSGKEGQDGLVLDDQIVAWAKMRNDAIWQVTFSPDSRRVAYITGQRLYVAGENSIPHHQLASWRFTFSPDSQHLAYVVKTPTGAAVMWDDRTLPVPSYGVYSQTFSKDSKHLIFAASSSRDNKPFIQVYIDGVPGEEYDELLPFPYDREPRFFFTAPDRFHYFAVKDGKIERVEVRIGSSSR